MVSSSSYSTQVTKLQERTNIPQGAESNPHHHINNGKRAYFKNPYPSYKPPDVWPYLIK